MQKAKVVPNIGKNILFIYFPQRIDEKILNSAYTDIRFCVKDLQKGFNVVVDYSKCSTIHINGIKILKKIIQFLVSNKIGEIIRVISSGNISSKQLTNFFRKINCYKYINVNNIDEANTLIENSKKRNGIRFIINNLVSEFEIEGKFFSGNVVDISTSGLAISCHEIYPVENTLVNIIIMFDDHDDLISIFQVKSRVIRSRGEVFAVNFIDIDDNLAESLYSRISYEVDRSLLPA